MCMAAMLSSCSDITDSVTDAADEEYAITLMASVSGMERMSSRAATTYQDTIPSYSNPLPTDVWLTTQRGVYTHDDEEYVTSTHPGTDTYHYHHTMTYTSGQLTFLSASAMRNLLLYPVNKNTPTYIVGFYPQGKFQLVGTAADADYGKTATASFDGKTDLMFAPEVHGSRKTEEKIARQDYKHILTWLKICARADNEDARAYWESITGIKLKNTANSVVVDLSTTDISELHPEFSGSIDMDFDRSAGSGPFTTDSPYALTTYITEIADILCAPVIINNPSADDAGATEYQLEIATKGGGTKTIDIQFTKDYDNNDIADGHYTASELYVISLAFGQSPVINASVTLLNWDNENRDLNMSE